jgi:hypothetical protein
LAVKWVEVEAIATISAIADIFFCMKTPNKVLRFIWC